MTDTSKYRYGAVYCNSCGKTHYYKSETIGGNVNVESVKCPACDKALEQQRAACGYHFLGSRDGDQGEWTCDLDSGTIEDVEELMGAVSRMGL